MWIRPEWKDALLGDLLEDFRRVPPAERKLYPHGRAEHFSYRPAGAPGRVFVRRARRGGLAGALLGGLYSDLRRPTRELTASAAALRAGVGVPEIVAVRATHVAGPFWKFTVVTREIEGAADLLALAESSLSFSRKRDVIGRVADEIRRLHEAGVYHADLTLKNILLSGPDVYIIDLDKAVLAGRRAEALDVMNLARLNRSVEKLLGGRGFVTRADKLRFLRRYLGGRARLKELARLCDGGLWLHRLWWSLTGQAGLPRTR